MPRARRLIAALAVAALCAPGTWLRTETPRIPPSHIAISRIAGPGQTAIAGWSREGVWQARATSLMFGGFSALVVLKDGRLRAFSDRQVRFTLSEPGSGSNARKVSRQFVSPARMDDLWDIESATRDPATGEYWLGYENIHTIHRFSHHSKIGPLRNLDREVRWPINGGAEAMVRLADGRFVIVPEGGDEGLLFAGDPVAGARFTTFPVELPVPGYAATDMAQLPDGRVLLLLRKLALADLSLANPPFASMIAIAAPPRAGQRGPWRPRLALDLAQIVPPENYEGLALRPRADGSVTVWLISDDNFSVLQRTLLVKLRFDPQRSGSRSKQKARRIAPARL